MVALKIEDIRQMTKKLFLEDAFDDFLLIEAKILTYSQFIIDGHLTEGYYSAEELEALGHPRLSSWKQLRPFCFSLIKGNRPPKSFQILLQLSPGDLEALLKEEGLHYLPASFQGLMVNLKYENNGLTAITTVSFKEFTMDKVMDQIWGQRMKGFLKQHEVPAEEI